MAGEWKKHQVSDLIADGKLVIGDGYRAKNEELSSQGLPFARAGNINDGFHFADADHFPLESIHRVGNKVSRAGDVVFTSKGTVGRFAFVRQETPRFVYSPQLCFWRSLDPKVIDPRFLSFWMFGREFFVQFKGVAGQTDMAEYVSLTDQRRMCITLPPIDEQRAIAAVLGSLDDKIESNRRTSRTLEKLARAIFRAWFVDFEPVKAKAAGARSFPGMPQEAFDALPTRLVPSELGPIPEGWGLGSLKDVVTIRMERVSASEGTARIPYVPIECISPKSLSLNDWKSGSEAQTSLQLFYRKDILFGAMRPYFHKVCLAPFDGTTRTTAFVLRPKQAGHYAYAALVLHDPMTVDYATQHSVGSTIPYAKWDGSLAEMPMVLPPPNHLDAFEEMVHPMLEPMMQYPFEDARLRTLRDYLLPKLLTGEVRVAEHSSGSILARSSASRERRRDHE